MRYGIAVDTAKCMACYCCQMACKDEHCGHDTALSKSQPMMGQFWIEVREWERSDSSRLTKTATVATLCAHCADPACAKAAKNGAVYKRDDGIVIIDPEKSEGQRQIADACPIGAVYYNEVLDIPQKCTMCAELLDDPNYLAYLGDPKKFKKPRCVEACPNNALMFGDLDDPDSDISKYVASHKQTQLEPLAGQETNVKYLNVPTVYLAGTVYLPKELEEVAIGAKVSLKADSGESWEVTTNYFGDWIVDDLPKNRQVDITVELAGYKPVKYTAKTDADHYVDMTYLQKA
ncbi:MAG: oxidoreductase [Oscillospiraceae bacterium]|nr:oxidoreductase [Oscillospiraceae bacterium]